MRYIVIVLLLFSANIFAGEYTDSFEVKGEGYGVSNRNDPVEAFNKAIQRAKADAIGTAVATIKSRAMSRDAVLEESYIEKNSNAQITNLIVTNYKFSGRGQAEVKIKAHVEYLNVSRFMDEYDKTVLGAALRTAAFPGWGQFYNKTYITGILYGVLFSIFYYSFVINEERVMNSNEYTDEIPYGEYESDREQARTSVATKYQMPAFILWAFAISDAMASRINGKRGLEGLRIMFRLDTANYKREYVDKGIIIDFIVGQVHF